MEFKKVSDLIKGQKIKFYLNDKNKTFTGKFISENSEGLIFIEPVYTTKQTIISIHRSFLLSQEPTDINTYASYKSPMTYRLKNKKIFKLLS